MYARFDSGLFASVLLHPSCIHISLPSMQGFQTRFTFLNVQCLGEFAELRKLTIGFVTPVCLSVRLKQLDPPLERFSWNLMFENFFRKYIEKIQVSSKSVENNGWTFVHLWKYLVEFFIEWDTLQTKLWRNSEYTFNLIFVVPCIMLYSGEISTTRCNSCVFLFAMALLYMFRVTISPIIRSTMLYMATG